MGTKIQFNFITSAKNKSAWAFCPTQHSNHSLLGESPVFDSSHHQNQLPTEKVLSFSAGGRIYKLHFRDNNSVPLRSVRPGCCVWHIWTENLFFHSAAPFTLHPNKTGLRLKSWQIWSQVASHTWGETNIKYNLLLTSDIISLEKNGAFTHGKSFTTTMLPDEVTHNPT